MVTLINDYLHEYDFPYHDYLLQYKENIITQYEVYKKQKSYLNSQNSNDLHINGEIPNYLCPKIDKIVQDNYWVGDPLMSLGLRIYVQNNKSNTSYYHQHTAGPGSLVGVFYLNPPENGGELSFKLTLDSDPWVLKPKKNKLYLFPNWVNHTPLPQEDEEYRICFNYAYGSNIRPIHKVTSQQW